MRGSPCSPVVADEAERLIGRPVSLASGESLNRKSWSSTGPNTWLMEPKWLPSKVIEIQRDELGSFSKERRFSNYGTNLRKEL